MMHDVTDISVEQDIRQAIEAAGGLTRISPDDLATLCIKTAVASERRILLQIVVSASTGKFTPHQIQTALLSAANERIRVLEEAIRPFAEHAVDDEKGPESEDLLIGLMRDRICDWLGPSDFKAARAAIMQPSLAVSKPASPA